MATGAQMGRPPKPTALKVLHGDRRDRVNTSEPKPRDGEVRCPSWLSKEAKAVWRRIAPDLIAKKVLTAWDVDAFVSFCNAVANNRLAQHDLDENGLRIVVPVRELANGEVVYDVRSNPNWQVVKETSTLIATLGGRFGLNPSDRSRLSVGEEADRGKGAERLLG